MHILGLQLDLIWHDPKGNRDKVEAHLGNYQGPLDLLLLPEMFTTGFSMEAEDNAEPANGPTVQWMHELAKKRDCLIGGSLITEDAGTFFNRFYLVGPNDWQAHYDKRHTFRMAGEHENYDSGQKRVVVEYNGWKILLLVCYDLRFPVWSRNRNTDDGLEYDLILLVANWPTPRVEQWETLVKARAIENQCYIAAINRVGEDGKGIPYSGRSMMVDPRGEALVAARHQETSILAELSQDRLNYYRERFPFWMDADEFEMKD